MGVLYHRRSRLNICGVKISWSAAANWYWETLVIEGDEHAVLVPGDRYAQMRNVYFIPSALALKNWLEKCGFGMCGLPMSA